MSMMDILKPGGHEDKGEMARMQYFVGGIAIGEMIRSTLGPYGMNKILQPMSIENSELGETTMTNDGATILKSVWLDNPAAKILSNVAMRQDNQFGDGTTSVVVLASELLRGAENLINSKIHPQVIVQGYQAASEMAMKRLEEISFDYSKGEQFTKILYKLARTTLSSKLPGEERDLFAKMAVDAVMRIKNTPYSLELIQVLKKPGGLLSDSFLDEGFILDKHMGVGQKKEVKDCKVLIANTSMDADKIKIYGAKVSVDSFNDIASIESAERDKMKKKVDAIARQGCTVFINRQLIYSYPESLLRDKGILSIEHSDFDNMERLSVCLGAEIVSTFERSEGSGLGSCGKIQERMIGEDRVIHFSDCAKNGACTIVLRGSSAQILSEAERSLHDALAIVSQTLIHGRTIYGAGCAEIAMAIAIEKAAVSSKSGKMAQVYRTYADALKKIPTYILENAGLESCDLIKQIEYFHHEGNDTYGIDIENQKPNDMEHLGILESYDSKRGQISSATEAAEMLIRVDDIITCAPRQRSGM